MSRADPADEAALVELATALADGVEAALPGWVEASVARLVVAWTGAPPSPEVAEAARRAGERARDEVGPQVRALLLTDLDEQRTGPLAVVRRAVRYPTEVLRAAGVPPVERDELAERQFPDDDYDLAPARFDDLAPDLHEPGLRWGAAKAFVHKARRRAAGSG